MTTEQIQNIIDRFDNFEPFESIDDIPDIPIVPPDIYQKHIIPNLIRCGAIPKNKLEINAEYDGVCRNSSIAKWNGTVFEYNRYKWGTRYIDTINHFEDDDGHDLFVPIRKRET